MWQEAVRRKHVDVFVGGVTAGDAREGSGMYFTPGYLRFKSRLYIHQRDFGKGAGIQPWLTRDRKVGVIEASSSLALLEEIKKIYDTPKEFTKLEPIEFSSFPGMEAAMDRGVIDGMIVDDTFVSGHPDWNSLDLETLEKVAWERYAKRFLGSRKTEQISMAVAVDEKSQSSLFSILTQLLDGHHPDITQNHLGKLCGIFWEPAIPGKTDAGFHCGERE